MRRPPNRTVLRRTPRRSLRTPLTQKLGRGVTGMLRWLLLVVLFVLVIACGGVAWLYHNATPDMLPQIKATFDGQELAPTAYKWHVPIVGSWLRRTYAETLNPTRPSWRCRCPVLRPIWSSRRAATAPS